METCEVEHQVENTCTTSLPVTDCAEAPANYYGRNIEQALTAPVAWTGSLDIPDSLFLTEAPDWWCQEACSFDQTGIGAFGDVSGECNGGADDGEPCAYDEDCDGVGTCDGEDFCKLPAEIRYDDGVCTPLAGAGESASIGITLQGITWQ